jgi:hypothetical protein
VRTDPVTGLEVPDYEYVPMWMVVTKQEHLPDGHKAVGVGIAHAIKPTKAEAIAFQLQSGLRATTEIVET